MILTYMFISMELKILNSPLHNFSDTTLVNYGESTQNANLESEIIETYSDSSQNVETIHRADELGNIYTDNSDTFVSSQPDTLADQYEPYMNEYSFDHSNLDHQAIDITDDKHDKLDDDNKDSTIVPNMNEFQQGEAIEYESQITEEMLINEREREKKSKKELEEEEREKMQYVNLLQILN